MRIKFEFDDELPAYDVMDLMFLSYMKNERNLLKKYLKSDWNIPDIDENEKIIEALSTLINYFGKYNGNTD